MSVDLSSLGNDIDGEVFDSTLMRTIYATDASVYREFPVGVVLPKHAEDIKKVITFARANNLSIIPRSAGTSLAGQCVGTGIVVDISKYMTNILELNVEERWVRLQPGVVRDELNRFLKPHGLFFGPNTSTANRCMIGGMVGNNSCGTTSIVYGSTRDHVISLNTILSDGSEVVFSAVDEVTFHQKRTQGKGLEKQIYQQAHEILSNPDHQEEIIRQFPKPSIHRRNTGYAVDLLLQSEVFGQSEAPFDFTKMLCGSEGTLAFTTEIKLSLDPLPDPIDIVVCPHFHTLKDSLVAVQIAMAHQPTACELMDKTILDCTKANIEQLKNRFFLDGDPQAVLMIEFRGNSEDEVTQKAKQLVEALQSANLGYAFPIVDASQSKRVWDLRKAGLGVLANLPGAPKAVACIEDTAVDIQDLPEFISEFSEIMAKYGQKSVYYAHAGAGEIHLRPILDLKKSKDRQLFYDITKDTAELVKRYDGSLSGEHGDGRVRAPFIPLMVGEKNYQLFKSIKKTWDPNNIFNPGKIVDTAPMNEDLRYEADRVDPAYRTILDFSQVGGMLIMAEKCNGSGDCRKLPGSGGTMCPSYMASRNEKDTTRARANVLREFLTHPTKENAFDNQEIYDILKLCLSCKGCTSECPSSVDMASMKAEFLHQYYQSNRRPLSNLVFGHFTSLAKLAAPFAPIANFANNAPVLSSLIKSIMGVAPKRTMPRFHRQTLQKWYKKEKPQPHQPAKRSVYLFCDEFTNYNDVGLGKKAIQLLTKLGYDVKLVDHPESGRAPISKGLLTKARSLAEANVSIFHKLINAETPLIGIEPSAILSFRDEYPRLVRGKDLQEKAKQIAQHTMMIEDFLAREVKLGHITPDQFHDQVQPIKLHGHCHQKALDTLDHSAFVLSIPQNYDVEIIPSGCCGMAGSFGYEKSNYEMSMQVGELVLFPTVRDANPQTIIAAPGTSCRHQIYDGTGKQALHPVEILFNALKN